MWESESSVYDAIFKKNINYSEFMTQRRFKDIRGIMSYVFMDKNLQGKDDWWMILGGVNGLNENRKTTVNAPNIKVMDETMSAFCPQTTKTGNLPHLSWILRKPEPLGTEFKTLAAVYISESKQVFVYNIEY